LLLTTHSIPLLMDVSVSLLNCAPNLATGIVPEGVVGEMVWPISHSRLNKTIHKLENATNTPISETESKTASGLARNTSHASYSNDNEYKGHIIGNKHHRLDLPRRLLTYAQPSPYYQAISERKEFQ